MANETRDFKLELIREIRENVFPSGYANYELGVRCPFCGDSIKDPTHYHLNIRVNPDDNQPLCFRCLRCNTTGLLTANVLAMIGAASNEMAINVERYNRVSCKKNGITMTKSGIRLELPELNVTDKVKEKHLYLENRLGCKLDIEEMYKKKVVYDFVGLMRHNNIKKLTTSLDKVRDLQNDHVGFLSTKNDFINFRDITGKHKRYYIYKVKKTIDTTGKFYIMPNHIDAFSDELKTINIAEGVFDIFGIYNHLFGKKDKNMIYAAINGSGYLNVIKHILNCGIICDVDVNIFSDADRPPDYYQKMIKVIRPFVNDIRLFYNNIGKDYGVPANEIQLKEIEL